MMSKLSYAFLITAIISIPLYASAENPPNEQGEVPMLATHVVASSVNSDLMIGQAQNGVQSELESRIVEGKYDDVFKDDFGDDILLITRRAYAARLYRPIWSREGAASLQTAADELFAHGIIADKVFKNDLERLTKTRFESKRVRKKSDADIKMTLAFFRIARAISGELKDEGGVAKPRINGPMKFNLTDALIKAGAGDVAGQLSDLEPDHVQYGRLKTVLAQYRSIRDAGGWLAIREGDIFELGETDKRVPLLRKRLAAEGFYSVPVQSYADLIRRDRIDPLGVAENNIDSKKITVDEDLIYDEILQTSLKEFQRRHGLEDDGLLGANTLKALNESVESKIDRIADSMHRWRHQGDLGSRYIIANIPSYTAEGWNNEVREISMRTIVGKRRFATPEFSDEVEYLVANPNWYVPISITRRQKLPKMRKDSNYAQRFNYTVTDRKTGKVVDPSAVDWNTKGVARKYRFVQGPGDGNALGEMKIIFPNQYSVYLHGTPTEHLFVRAQRAFSSGCVRLEYPVAMAEWIAKADEDVSLNEIKKAIQTDENERFNLNEKLPVHITYFTVTVGSDGSPNFWRDVYQRTDGIKYVKRYAKPLKNSRTLIEQEG